MPPTHTYTLFPTRCWQGHKQCGKVSLPAPIIAYLALEAHLDPPGVKEWFLAGLPDTLPSYPTLSLTAWPTNRTHMLQSNTNNNWNVGLLQTNLPVLSNTAGASKLQLYHQLSLKYLILESPSISSWLLSIVVLKNQQNTQIQEV